MKHMKFDVNRYVKVKLTKQGHEWLRKQHDEFNEQYNGVLGEYRTKGEDEDGYTSFQLHELMNVFGPLMVNGNMDAPFEQCEVLFPIHLMTPCN